MRLREGAVFQGFERSSESRGFRVALRVPKDGVAPEDDTTDDRNKRERSRVRRWIEADETDEREDD
ncbi:hypothetical protein BY996DRAFT_6615044, partial [Phakopsora pachyrhizi]